MPHWIQVETLPQGSFTSALQVDLDFIEHVQIQREKIGSKTVIRCGIRHKDMPMKLDEAAASHFLAEWEKYLEQQGGLKYKAPEANPGNVILPSVNAGELQAHKLAAG